MTFETVDVGVPQGSPISPLLFVIYVAPLHSISLPRGITLSYVDDFALTKASNSYRSNIRHLQRAWVSLQRIGASLHITFSIPKTELLHWRTPCDRSTKYIGPISLDNHLFHPLDHVKWLGFWFSSTLTTHHHFQQRYVKACKTFGYLQSLSKPGSGLTAYNARTLAQAVILPTLLYGAEVFQPKTAALNKLNSIWTRVLRWVTNCFTSTHTNILFSEAALLPLETYCKKARLLFAIRILNASPRLNPVAARLAHNFPLPDTYRTRKSFRHLLAGRPNLPKRWDFPNTSPTKPLPIDIIAIELKTLFLLNNPEGDFLTPFTITKAQAIEHCITHWHDTFPTPEYYNLTSKLKPHHFMKLDKFTSGRLHQFRAQKSYLASHQSWYNSNLSTRCPRCYTEPEDLHHAILQCPMRSFAREEFIPDLHSLDDIWDSPLITNQVALYIRATLTGYPPGRSGWFPCSPSASSDDLSEVASISSSIFSLQVLNVGV
jgi:hypothetical protein